MDTCLVTGAAGFIGSHVVDELIQRDFNVIALDDLSGGFRQNVNSKARFIQASVTDPDVINKLFCDYNIDYVFHLAAYAAEGLSHFIKRFNYTNNLLGSVNMINAAVNSGTVKCFVFTSSIAVYGKNQVPMSEEMSPRPEDPYGIAKYAVELDLREAYEMFGLNYIIFRPHNVYGERQNIGDPYRNVIGIFMNQILKGEPMTIFGDGRQTRAFSYIMDVAPVIAESVLRNNAYGQTFNIGAGTPYEVRCLAETVARHMGVDPRFVNLPARSEVVHAFSSHERVRCHFGDMIHGICLEDGIRKMAAWVKKEGAKEGCIFTGIEVHKNMPLHWANLLNSSDKKT